MPGQQFVISVLLFPWLAAIAAAAETEVMPPARVLIVTADGTGEHATIQQAIDAARPGDVVRIGPGVFRETVAIAKPVTLQGAGWDRTRIVSVPDEDLELTPEVVEALGRIAQERNAETRAKLRKEIVRVYGTQPAIRVSAARDVMIRGLGILRSEEVRKGGFTSVAAVDIEDSSVVVEDVALLESPGIGLAARGVSHLTMRHCLVTNAWGKGLVIDVANSGSFEIVDSEIRNNCYAGVSIDSTSPGIRIRRCRIHGTGWHGIRYDSGRPRIEGNVFHTTAASGIYASGKTAAVVRNNLFYHSGMSCWFQNGDTIEANTFVGARHTDKPSGMTQGVQVLGASTPNIRRNLFVACEYGVYFGNIGGDRPHSRSTGAVNLVGNVFWDNARNLARSEPAAGGDSSMPLPEGNRELQPAFVDAANDDFRLQKESPLAEAGVGARDFVDAGSDWPLQPEEARAIAEIEKRFSR